MKQDKIWEIYQNDPELQNMGCRDGGRVNFIARSVPVNAKALNIGVGRGTLERLLSEKGVDVHCLDPSETSINNVRDALDLSDKARVGYAQEIPFAEESFDYVIMTEVLEHLSDEVLIETRSEVRRVLKTGGVFLGSVPADEALVEGVVICPDCGKRFHRWGHVQSFSKARLEAFLSELFIDFSITREVFADWKSLNWKGKLGMVAKKVQARVGKQGGNQSFFFVAKKTV